jgi:hypothetical protein
VRPRAVEEGAVLVEYLLQMSVVDHEHVVEISIDLRRSPVAALRTTMRRSPCMLIPAEKPTRFTSEWWVIGADA